MQAEYLAACHILNGSVEASEQELGFYNLLSSTTQHNDLVDHINFWQKIQLWERLLGLQSGSLNQVPEPFLSTMLAQLGCESVAELSEQQAHVQSQVAGAMESFFSRLDPTWQVKDWEEKPVHWR